MERMSTQVQTRSPELDELTCVPETLQSQQAAGVEEVVGVEDPLQKSDTEQSDKSTTREGQYISEERADKRVKKVAVLFSARMSRN